jgi:glycyl-tRNA synthetase beta subunit
MRKYEIARRIGEHIGKTDLEILEGGTSVDVDLLDEVAYLVEFPNVLEGSFDEVFNGVALL